MVGGIANDYNDIIKTLHIMDADELKSNYFFAIRIGFPQKIYIYFSLDRTGDPISQRCVLQVLKHGEPGEGGHDDKVLVKKKKILDFTVFSFSKKIYFLNPDTLTWEAVRKKI